MSISEAGIRVVVYCSVQSLLIPGAKHTNNVHGSLLAHAVTPAKHNNSLPAARAVIMELRPLS